MKRKVKTGRKVMSGDIVFNLFEINTTRPISFLNALEKLCKSYATKDGKYSYNYRYTWKVEY